MIWGRTRVKTELPTYLSDENQAKRSSGRRFRDVFIDLRPEQIYCVRGVVAIVVIDATSLETWVVGDVVSVAVEGARRPLSFDGISSGHVWNLVCWHCSAR